MALDLALMARDLQLIPETAADPDEVRWVARAKAGEEAAYLWLLARYRQRAVGMASKILRRPSEGEDVAQEAFIRAFRQIGALRGDQRFLPWLYRIIVRLCLDRKRLARWEGEQPWDTLPQTPGGRRDALGEAVTERMVVESLLDHLSPPMRAVLVLRELEGLEYEEIALVMAIPIGTVRSRLNTARDKFRVLWIAAMKETSDV